jgi:hypothetical protein
MISLSSSFFSLNQTTDECLQRSGHIEKSETKAGDVKIAARSHALKGQQLREQQIKGAYLF